MTSRIQLLWLTVCLLFIFAGSAPAQEQMGRNMAEMKFVTLPGMPTCALGSVQSGDPATGPSVLLAKLTAGCVVPWHWHTPNESVMFVSGTARLEMKDGRPLSLSSGGFARVPSKHIHQFRCLTPCTMFVSSDAAFDVHYVDSQGKEISPQDALKAVKETPAT